MSWLGGAQVVLVPVDHDPWAADAMQAEPVANEDPMPSTGSAFASAAPPRLTMPTRRGEIADNPDWFWAEAARRTAADPYADPFDAPAAGAATAAQARQTMGVVRPSLLERAAESLASYFGGGFREHPIYRMVSEGRWNDLDHALGDLHQQGQAHVADAVASAIRQALGAPYDPDFAKWRTDPAAFARAARTSFDIASNITTPGLGRAAVLEDAGLGATGGRARRGDLGAGWLHTPDEGRWAIPQPRPGERSENLSAPNAQLLRDVTGLAPEEFDGHVINRPGIVNVRGTLLRPDPDGRMAPIGEIERSMRPRDGLAYHDSLDLSSGEQGKATGARILQNNIDFYRRNGINHVGVAAVDWGPYVWSKYGFVPHVDSWAGLRDQIATHAYQMYDTGDLAGRELETIFGNVADPDPKAVWAIADNRTPVPGRYAVKEGEPAPATTTLGKALLYRRGEGFWYGGLKLTDPEMMQRFDDYVRQRLAR